jgi:hypothetical protein
MVEILETVVTEGKIVGDPSNILWNRNLQTTVVKKVLVIRVVDCRCDKPLLVKQNWKTKSLVLMATYSTSNPYTISAPTDSCSLNLNRTTSSDLMACTLSAFRIPYAIGAADGTIRDAAIAQASTDFGNVALYTIADYVMVCLPPGTSGGGWLAYAYLNYWLSVYNDYWCKSPSVQMHEMGTFIRAICLFE